MNTDPASLAAATGARPGDVLAGKYRVERVLGQGGMGVVVAAHHIQLDERVALKFLRPEALLNAEAVARFAREARAAVKIKSEHVARVSDVGQLENGSPYMVMEYLEGGDLAAWLRQRGPLSTALAVDFVLQTCEALADAHALGIIHRDLKPANLFCIQRSDGQLSVKVLDFGISKVAATGASGNDMTRTSALMGTPLYMSPEQMHMSKAVDARSDVWALGVILFELLTARPPFEGEAVTDLAIKVATQPAPSVRALRPDVPVALDEVIATCLAKDRAARFQNVGELATALGAFGPPQSRVSVDRVLGTLRQAGLLGPSRPAEGFRPQSPSSSGAQGVSPPATSSSWGQTSPGAGSRGKVIAALAIGGAVVVVGAVGIAGRVLVRKGPDTGASATAAVKATAGSASSSGAFVVPPPSVAALSATPPAVSTHPTAAVSSVPVAPASVTPGVAAWHPAGRSTPVAPSRSPAGAASAAGAGKNCNPPYVIDSAGDRQYKPECL